MGLHCSVHCQITLKAVLIVLMGFQHSDLMQLDSLIFQQILIDGFNGLGTVMLSLISENPGSRFMLEWMLLLCRFGILYALLDLCACSLV